MISLLLVDGSGLCIKCQLVGWLNEVCAKLLASMMRISNESLSPCSSYVYKWLRWGLS